MAPPTATLVEFLYDFGLLPQLPNLEPHENILELTKQLEKGQEVIVAEFEAAMLAGQRPNSKPLAKNSTTSATIAHRR